MKKIQRIAIFALLLTCHLSLVTTVRSDIHTANSVSQSDVMDAINAASDGDTVLIPAGTGTWTTTVNISKNLIIKGAGMDQTVIVDKIGDIWGNLMDITLTADNPFRLCHLTINGYEGENFAGGGTIHFRGISRMFRIDHVKFLNMWKNVWTGVFDVHGVVDHCAIWAILDPPASGKYAQYFWMTGPGDVAYTRPLSLGTADALFFEDNDIQYSGSVTSNRGGNIPWFVPWGGNSSVVRYNNIVNSQIEVYPPGVMRGRGSLSFEYYNNTISAVDCKQGNPQTTLSFGGGTGVIFNNTYTGTTWNSGGYLEIHSYRTYAKAGIYGKCDGTSSYDGNLPLNGDTETYTGTHTGSDGQTVLTCAGKSWTPDGLVDLAVWNLTDLSVGLITTNTANTITVTLDNGKRNNWNNGDSFKVTNGYPCMDGPGRGVNGPDVNQSGMPIQLAEPVYEWNNTYNGENLDFHHYWTSELHPEYVVEGRDYYNDTQRPGYTPYTYPHPLQTILGDDPNMTMSSGMPR